ncbi:hypothetical protein SAY86_008235 [Trapa natans]|uniref:histidine kinase n=1 Tax=Trapa natans TaxID=22666 RepID=A0AAN7QAM2_TRANT|nr:hypothetical protein SAY86_008235 [Trapa natans]
MEAADERNSWESFRHLLAEDAQFDSLDNSASFNDGVITLMVSVEDTGIGIPLSAQDRVFTPFMQADSSTSRNYGGTGIGLSISKCLVELMGGQISFISRPQIGSTFSFSAVFGRYSNKVKLTNGEKLVSEELPSSFRGLKAILVDEKPVRAAVTRYHLKRLGINVEVVSSANKISAQSGMNGSLNHGYGNLNILLVEKDTWLLSEEDNCSNIHALDRKQNGNVIIKPPKVLLATKILAAEFEKAKTAGFSDTIIMKPLRASMIAACLQQVLGIGRKKQPGKDAPPNGICFLKTLLTGKKILVVDDNRVNLRVAAGALKKFGAHVECAESGKAALAKLQLPHNFDACFMDIQMPEMDGCVVDCMALLFEATRQIRVMEREANEQMTSRTGTSGAIVEDGDSSSRCSSSREWHVPVLAMTADVIHATYDKCVKCGMDGYVSKPFEEENLYQAVSRFFKTDMASESQLQDLEV